MTTYNYNRFRDTTIYGNFVNDSSGSYIADAIFKGNVSFDKNIMITGNINLGLNSKIYNNDGTEKYLTQDNADFKYLTRNEAYSIYVTNNDADYKYLSRNEASSFYLTTAVASSIYLDVLVAGSTYLSKVDASNTYLKTVDVSSYLKSVDASNTYLKRVDASNTYLKSVDASNTYLKTVDATSAYLKTVDASNTYLKTVDATSTYLSKTDASNTYLKTVDATSTYLSKTDASNTYLKTVDGNSTYLSKTDASNNYLKTVDASNTYLKIDTLNKFVSLFANQSITSAYNNYFVEVVQSSPGVVDMSMSIFSPKEIPYATVTVYNKTNNKLTLTLPSSGVDGSFLSNYAQGQSYAILKKNQMITFKSFYDVSNTGIWYYNDYLLSSAEPETWFIYSASAGNRVTNAGYNIDSLGFNTVATSGRAEPTSWNKTEAKFIAPSNGLYYIQFNIFCNSTNLVARTISIGGTGYNRGLGATIEQQNQYCIFNNTSTSTESSYQYTTMNYMNSGDSLFFFNSSNTPITLFYAIGHTNLKIIKMN